MRIVAALVALTFGACAARAAECGPDKLGTERVQPVGTQGGLEVGLKTYPRTIPLADHEVILTFDDGPDAVNTPKILDALKADCVRATFFEIGRNAAALPQIARREVLEGHTVAHHTWSHPQPTLRFMGEQAARADILRGMIAVEKAAYGRDVMGAEPKDLKLTTPWFRFPGFADTQDLRDWFKANDVGTFGVDLWASDWIKMTPDEELKLIMSRLEKNGHKGMLLMHDNHPWTAAMVPMLLKRLKADGYKIVHMTGGGAGSGPTAPAPPGWTSETERVIGALKPRLERAASRRLASPIPVKPAPTE
jgi:peptidoglycan/xylan/chitin deacetylase (PgdA/CDA1 family)